MYEGFLYFVLISINKMTLIDKGTVFDALLVCVGFVVGPGLVILIF